MQFTHREMYLRRATHILYTFTRFAVRYNNIIALTNVAIAEETADIVVCLSIPVFSEVTVS